VKDNSHEQTTCEVVSLRLRVRAIGQEQNGKLQFIPTSSFSTDHASLVSEENGAGRNLLAPDEIRER
jgi:hypothetical protein